MSAKPTSAESYEAVLTVLRGERVPLDAAASKMLWLMLEDSNGCDAEITPSWFWIRFGRTHSPHRYLMQIAPAVVSFLLDGESFPATRRFTRRIGPAIVPTFRDYFPSWKIGTRFVLIEALIGRTVIRVRDLEAALASPIPELPPHLGPAFVVLDRACPHCGQVPERYRVLLDGSHVCQACGCSSRP
jgi:hypothetical protein